MRKETLAMLHVKISAVGGTYLKVGNIWIASSVALGTMLK